VQRIAVHSGFVEVSDNHVALLCDVAELAEDIDVERAKASLDNAKNDLASDPSNADAEAAIHRAEVRLEASAGI
jgi:F-type H+-transporting ATPase subunit epsilon